MVSVTTGDTSSQGFDVPLPGFPSQRNLEWSDWLPKFRPGGLLVVHCGGRAGLFSAMIGGWANGELGSQPVMREIRP